MNTREIGNKYEDTAVEQLEKSGYKIIERNFYCKNGEIDIVAKDDSYLCFIEVRYRKKAALGYPSESINSKKQKKIIASAMYYLYKNGYPQETPCRFDAVVIYDNEVEIIKDAFEIT